MTEDLKTPVSGEVVKDNGLPQPKFSEPTPASPTSALSPDQIAAFSSALKPIIEDTIDRKFKSTTDKRFSRLEKLEKGEDILKEVLTSLKEQGVVLPPQLEQQYQIREAVERELSARGVVSPTDKSISSGTPNQVDTFNVVDDLKTFELDTNNPEVLNALRGQYRNHDHFLAELGKLKVRLSKPSTPSDTVSPAPAGGHVPQPENNDALIAELQTLQKNPAKNSARMKEIEKLLGW